MGFKKKFSDFFQVFNKKQGDFSRFQKEICGCFSFSKSFCFQEVKGIKTVLTLVFE